MKATKEQTVSAFDAKTHLARLLADAEQGRAVTITRRGKPVARLVPYAAPDAQRDVDDLLAAMRELRGQIARRGKRIDIKRLIEEGRRF